MTCVCFPSGFRASVVARRPTHQASLVLMAPGRQCAYNAIVSAVLNEITQVSQWTTEDLDAMLKNVDWLCSNAQDDGSPLIFHYSILQLTKVVVVDALDPLFFEKSFCSFCTSDMLFFFDIMHLDSET